MNILELLYFIGYKTSKLHKTLRKKHLDFPVISVGNITLGGTGKTPAVMAIAQEALKRGHKPCILTRGYMGKIKKPVFVSRGYGALYPPLDVGDEAVLLSERLKGIEVIKSPNRYKGGLLSNNSNLFIIDDGYQHWHLHRDADILLIDSINPFGNRRLFPLGILREPLREIKRADTVVITRATGNNNELLEELRKYNKDAFFYFSDIKPSWLVKKGGDLLPIDGLFKKRVYAFCGIGNPGSFIQSILKFGISLVGFKSFSDHHFYSEKEINTILEEVERTKAELVITTEKDFIKLREIDLPENFLALRVEFFIDESFYDNIFNQLK